MNAASRLLTFRIPRFAMLLGMAALSGCDGGEAIFCDYPPENETNPGFAIVSKLDIGATCIQLRKGGEEIKNGAPNQKAPVVAAIVDPERFPTMCTVKLAQILTSRSAGSEKDTACVPVTAFNRGDEIKINRWRIGDAENGGMSLSWYRTGEKLVHDIPLTTEIKHGNHLIGYRADFQNLRFDVFIEYVSGSDKDKWIHKKYLVEVTVANDPCLETHDPLLNSVAVTCPALPARSFYDIVVNDKTEPRQGNSGGGGEPPPLKQ